MMGIAELIRSAMVPLLKTTSALNDQEVLNCMSCVRS